MRKGYVVYDLESDEIVMLDGVTLFYSKEEILSAFKREYEYDNLEEIDSDGGKYILCEIKPLQEAVLTKTIQWK